MNSAAVLKKSLDLILFGVVIAVGTPIAIGYFSYQWIADAFSDSSSISFASECRGRIIGADNSMSRFVFYGENKSGASTLQELCVTDLNEGAVEFYDHPEGYKNKRALGRHLIVNSRFSVLPPELAKPFKSADLPRFQFNSQGLLLVREEYGDRIEAAAFSYEELGLAGYSFSDWPADSFAGFSSGLLVNYEKIYNDDDEYNVSVTNGSEQLASFNLRQTEAWGQGLVVRNHVLIPMDDEVAIYDFSGRQTGDGFCCAERIRLLPGHPDWILAESDELRLWKVSELGL